VALTIARNLGLRTPIFSTLRVAADKAVLVSERFDRGAGGERHGYISASTALGVGSNDDRRITYEEFSDTIAELSTDPARDLREMFSRIALTVLINNVDDHWRNHGFLREKHGWRLSPLFDVNPNPRRGVITSRAISAEDDPTNRDIANLLNTADAYKLSSEQGVELIGAVATAVEQWPRIARDLGIPDEQQPAMARAFDEKQLRRAHELRPTGRR
jgi:serine/threonine-protein kinase HipA